MIRNQAEEAVHRCGNGFAAVNAIAKRSRQLQEGAPPLVAAVNLSKPAMTALREIAAGKVTVTP